MSQIPSWLNVLLLIVIHHCLSQKQKLQRLVEKARRLTMPATASSLPSVSPMMIHFLLILHVLSLQFINSNTKSSATHWKLITTPDGKSVVTPLPTPQQNFNRKPNAETDSSGGGAVVKDWSSFQRRNLTDSSDSIHDTRPNPRRYFSEAEDELVLQILTSTIVSSRGSWIKNGHHEFLRRKGSQCDDDSLSSTSYSSDELSSSTDSNDVLDCGRHANFTYYDQLIGIANRQNHPHIPEPQVALLFRKKNSKKETVDLNVLERKLRKAKKEKPGSVQLYNQIGNFWRIKGNTVRAIECFRRALAVAPNNPEVLHNLARLLLYIGYLDDSLFLARRSLELQNDRGAWQQHFTLGEILKAYGHHQEALLHFKHTLELRPDHVGAQEALHELETLLSGTGLHAVTLIIIIFLVIGVLLVMLSSLDSDDSSDSNSRPPHRHFSRALAMRSLKLGISPRALRAKRLAN